jgi:hypothetical protein
MHNAQAMLYSNARTLPTAVVCQIRLSRLTPSEHPGASEVPQTADDDRGALRLVCASIIHKIRYLALREHANARGSRHQLALKA